MARRKLKSESGKSNYRVVRTGGPMKYFNTKIAFNPFSRKPRHSYEQIEAKWYADVLEELRLARLSQNLTQAQLAKLVGSTQSEISRLEQGKTNPSIFFLNQIIDTLSLKLTISIKK